MPRSRLPRSFHGKGSCQVVAFHRARGRNQPLRTRGGGTTRQRESLRVGALPPDEQGKSRPMNSRASGRTYRGVFGSRTPQRPEPGPAFAVSPTSTKFQRSNAQIIGPGSYDPLPASAWQDFSSERPLSSFASTRDQRGVSNIGSSTKGIDLAHSTNLERSGSTHMNRSMYSTAPGSNGQRWTSSLRKAPYFHTPVRSPNLLFLFDVSA